jgi:hypothetical protein
MISGIEADRPTADPNLAGLVDHLRHNPGDDVTRNILADLFDESPGFQVEWNELPRWFRLCWLRSEAGDRIEVIPRRDISNAGVVWELENSAVDYTNGLLCDDYWGRVEVAGLDCLLLEPNLRAEYVQEFFAVLSAQLGTGWAFQREDESRNVILFPPLTMLPRRRLRKQQTFLVLPEGTW